MNYSSPALFVHCKFFLSLTTPALFSFMSPSGHTSAVWKLRKSFWPLKKSFTSTTLNKICSTAEQLAVWKAARSSDGLYKFHGIWNHETALIDANTASVNMAHSSSCFYRVKNDGRSALTSSPRWSRDIQCRRHLRLKSNNRLGSKASQVRSWCLVQCSFAWCAALSFIRNTKYSALTGELNTTSICIPLETQYWDAARRFLILICWGRRDKHSRILHSDKMWSGFADENNDDGVKWA